MKPTDIQMVKTIGAVKPRSIKVAIGTGILFLLILFLVCLLYTSPSPRDS